MTQINVVYGKGALPRLAWLGRSRFSRAGRSVFATISPRDYTKASDAELALWSSGGDRRAFDGLVTQYGSFALRVAGRLASDRSAAEDIVQEAMVRAWKQIGSFDPERGRFTTWLYRIVVNLCIDDRRRSKPEQMADDFDAADPAYGADAVIEDHEQRAGLAVALRALPVHQRGAIALVYDEGLSGAEAARVMGLSAKAVERLLARARTHLRESLKSARD
jgi:RNA polymerase sigma-70 factor (ECF subfamily)